MIRMPLNRFFRGFRSGVPWSQDIQTPREKTLTNSQKTPAVKQQTSGAISRTSSVSDSCASIYCTFGVEKGLPSVLWGMFHRVAQWWCIQKFRNIRWLPTWELTYPIKKKIRLKLKMVFLFPRWDMLAPWRVCHCLAVKDMLYRLHAFVVVLD